MNRQPCKVLVRAYRYDAEGQPYSKRVYYALIYDPSTGLYSAGCRENWTAEQALKHWMRGRYWNKMGLIVRPFLTARRLRATLFPYAIMNNEAREKRLGRRP